MDLSTRLSGGDWFVVYGLKATKQETPLRLGRQRLIGGREDITA